MEKYTLLPEQLVYEGTLAPENFFEPDPLSEEAILAIHDAEYWQKLKTLSLTPQEERKTGFPQSRALIDREVIIAGGTVQAAEYALQFGFAMNIAGGTHHAFTNRGEGFCLLNDIALGASHLLLKGKARQVLVIDLDVHQGNGTAQIFRDRPEVYTFSMHCVDNYPLKKEISDRDLNLKAGTGDALYLSLLRDNLDDLFATVRPDFVFFLSGVDVLCSDKLGHLKLTIEGCRERDRLVWQKCRDAGVPAVAVMGGGYSRSLRHIIEAHANTYRLAVQLLP